MRRITVGILSLVTAALVGVAGPVATAAAPTSTTPASAQTSASTPPPTPAGHQQFPSHHSNVIGSNGFIDDIQVGYFWSAARGDSVEQMRSSGKTSVTKATLKYDVVYDGLTSGAEVDWTMSINGTDVGSFTVSAGPGGPGVAKFTFPAISGPSYDVKIRVTNEVPSGDGAITLRYAGDGPHSISLKRPRQ